MVSSFHTKRWWLAVFFTIDVVKVIMKTRYIVLVYFIWFCVECGNKYVFVVCNLT